jgi:putative peptidoglycan lipid II flippase
MLRSLLSVGGFTLLSRLTGYLRDIVMAAVLGSGPLSDAFQVALRLPNNFRAIFAEGAFNAAFVPLFAGVKQRAGRPAALAFAADIMSWQILIQLVLLLAALIAMPWLMQLLAPGFSERPEQLALATEFTRITFAYLACIAIVSQYGAMLNAEGRFVAAAFAPVLLNLTMAAMLLAAWMFPTAGHAAAYGVLLGGVLELALLFVAARRADLAPPLSRPKQTPELLRFGQIFWPAVVGSASVQLGLFADTIIASFLPPGGLTSLYYADRINQLPIGVVGVALGTVLLPELSRRLAASDPVAAASAHNRAVELGLFLTLPCAALFLAVPAPIMQGLFARGAFDLAAADAAAAVLSAYALGLPAFILVRTFTPLFYAREDTATPVRATVFSVLVNIAVKVGLVLGLGMGVVGLALGTVAAAWVNLLTLAFFARRREILYVGERLKDVVPRIAAASLALGVAVYVADDSIGGALKALPYLGKEMHLAFIGLVAALVYGGCVLLLGLGKVLTARG